jgi:hypothetical protein
MNRYTWYVGVRREDGLRSAIRLPSDMGAPSERTHGRHYAAMIGPFKTKRGALWMATYGRNNPHVQHVDDAERLARRTA